MKAVVYTRFGPPEVLELRDVPKPNPARQEVLIRIHATTVTSAEAAMRRGQPLWGRVIIGFFRPRKRMRVLGIELAGVIEAVGAAVTRFAPGDEVFGFAGFAIGANAEYMCMLEESAAAVDGASTALFFLRDKVGVYAGQRVLVIGAAGSIGTYAVQLARMFGAEVTGVCSTRNIDLVTSLGADRVIDYTREDFTKLGQTWDVVFDTVGKSSFARCNGALTPTGCYVATTGLFNYALAAWTRLRGGKRVLTGMSVDKRDALEVLRPLLESGALRIVIDRRYTLEQIVEAHRYVDTGRKRGNVVLSVREEGR
jgi:NADPH:quinone reductase-like Zn-dependent oxidoreductase